jgi:hypothetical protein
VTVTPPPDLQAYWDEVLIAEDPSLSPVGEWDWIAGARLGLPHEDILERPVVWLSAVDPAARAQAREQLSRLLYWLPEADRQVISFRLRGLTQAEIGDELGLSQPSACYRLHKALDRLKALGAVRDQLPRDRNHLRRLGEAWNFGHQAHRESRGEFLRSWSETWSGAASSEMLGLQQPTVYRWQVRASEHDGIIGALARVLRTYPSSRGRR